MFLLSSLNTVRQLTIALLTRWFYSLLEKDSLLVSCLNCSFAYHVTCGQGHTNSLEEWHHKWPMTGTPYFSRHCLTEEEVDDSKTVALSHTVN